MNIWCRQHNQRLGVVRIHVGDWPEFVTLSPRWRARHSAEVGHPQERANSFTNLREWTHPDIVAKGCGQCGSRTLEVAVILGAFEEGLDKLSL